MPIDKNAMVSGIKDEIRNHDRKQFTLIEAKGAQGDEELTPSIGALWIVGFSIALMFIGWTIKQPGMMAAAQVLVALTACVALLSLRAGMMLKVPALINWTTRLTLLSALLGAAVAFLTLLWNNWRAFSLEARNGNWSLLDPIPEGFGMLVLAVALAGCGVVLVRSLGAVQLTSTLGDKP